MADDSVYDVPTKEQLLALVEETVSDPSGPLESDYFQYSEDINEILADIRDGEEVTDELRKELSDLYDEWEKDEFPVAEEDYDAISEGDPDLLPDPADV